MSNFFFNSTTKQNNLKIYPDTFINSINDLILHDAEFPFLLRRTTYFICQLGVQSDKLIDASIR